MATSSKNRHGGNASIRWLAAGALQRLGPSPVVGVLRSFLEQTESAVGRAEAEKLLESIS